MNENRERLLKFLEMNGDTELSADEIQRYLRGEMGSLERESLEAFLNDSPLARFDIEDARRQLQSGGDSAIPTKPTVPWPTRLPAWSMAVGLAVAAIAGFLIGHFTVRTPGANHGRRDIAREGLAPGKAAPTPPTQPLRRSGPSPGSKIVMREPVRNESAGYGNDTEFWRQMAVQEPGERSVAESSLVGLSSLEIPPPDERSSLKPLDRLVISLKKLSAHQPLESGLWKLKNDQAYRKIPFKEIVEKCHATIEPLKPLGPGEYAIGIRPADHDSVKSEEERPWHAFRFRVLTPGESERQKAAELWGVRDPMPAAMDLFGLGRLGEAAAVLRHAPGAPHAKETLAGIERWILDVGRGYELAIQPDRLEDVPPQPNRPSENTIYIRQQEPIHPLPGDSVEAIRALFREATGYERSGVNREKRLALFRQAFGMARRLDDQVRLAKVGFHLLQDLVSADESSPAEPYLVPSVEAARAGVRAFPPGGDLGDIEAFLGVFYWAGSAYLRTGRYREALAIESEGASYCHEEKLDGSLARLTFQVALVYQNMGDAAGAVTAWEKNLEVLSRLPEMDPSNPVLWVDQYGMAAANLASCHYQLAEYREAVVTCDAALKRQGKLKPEIEVSLFNTRGASEIVLGEDAKVEADLASAKAVLQKHPDPCGSAEVEITFGLYHLNRSRLAEAEMHFRTGKDKARAGNLPSIEQIAGVDIEAVGLLRQGKLDKNGLNPLPYLEEPSVQERLTRLDHETNYNILSQRWPEAERSAKEVLRLGDQNGLNGLRATALDNLAWAKANQGAFAEAGKLFEESRRAVRASLDRIPPERIGSVQQRSADGNCARYAWTLWKLGKVDEAQAVLNGERGLGLRACRGLPPRDEQAAVRKAVASHPDALFLQYARIDGDTMLLLASAANTPTRAFELRLSASSLAERISQWNLRSVPRGGMSQGATERTIAVLLGKSLLAPIEKAGLLNPRRFRRIVIADDDAIDDIPFEALIDSSGTRLIQRFAIRYDLALGLDPQRPPDANSSDNKLYCVGYGGAGGSPDQAPWADKEALEVSRLAVGSKLRMGAKAQKRLVEQEMPRYRILLLSTHGLSDVGDPLDSRLMLAPAPGDVRDLRAREVATLHLHADLAVLSGCETAAGEPAGGEGRLGMAWAFLAAGCRCVVGTDWRVNDQISKGLVVDFFQGLKAGADEDLSLRTAKLRLLHTPGKSHPYYWAAFRLIGDPGPTPLWPRRH